MVDETIDIDVRAVTGFWISKIGPVQDIFESLKPVFDHVLLYIVDFLALGRIEIEERVIAGWNIVTTTVG